MERKLISFFFIVKKPLIYVVEGIHDASRLQQVRPGISTFVIGGFGMNEETLATLGKLSEKNQLILLLDPDSAGTKLRQKIKEKVPETIDLFADQELCHQKHGKKIGIEHMTNSDLDELLHHEIEPQETAIITMVEIDDLGLMGQANSAWLRQEITKKLHLGHTNAKQFLVRLNYLGCQVCEIKEIISSLKPI
ncbi:Ribonuclease M5 [termite gut metagenome]|uniref:Ribonuclease M5 n=1 Tax=termite gut metagenome TaxID=433724 RepID=A0A5J4RAJ6_9ZZZZ